MPTDPVPLTAEIGVGCLVRLRTEMDRPFRWVVVRVGRWWIWRGKILISRQSDIYGTRTRWVYPAEVERVLEGGEWQ